MRFGVTIFATDQSMQVPELAVAAEERGFDSIWIPEHTHIPTSRRTPPPTGDAELAEEYKRSVDPFVALAAAAVGHRTIRLGTGIDAARAARADRDRQGDRDARPPVRRPVRASASASAGTRTRWRTTASTTGPAGHTPASTCSRCRRCGTTRSPRSTVSTSRSPDTWSWPKPEHARPGAHRRRRRDQAVRPHRRVRGRLDPDRRRGPGRADPPLQARPSPPRAAIPTAGASCPFGSHPSDEKLDHFADIGVTECVFRLPSAPADEVLPVLEEQARLIAKWVDAAA